MKQVSIVTKIIIAFFLSSILFMTIVNALYLIFDINKIKKELDKEYEMVFERMTYNLSNPVWNLDEESMIKVISFELNASFISGVAIVYTPDKLPLYIYYNKSGEKVVTKDFNSTQIVSNKIYNKNIMKDTLQIGSVTVYTNNSYSKEKIINVITESIFKLLLYLLFFIIISFSIIYVLVIKQIRILTNAVTLFSEKKFDTKIKTITNDEFGVLSSNFNTMALTIKNYSDNLEQIVVQRTKELVESEKMASLGCLVAGIAHEINTPIGISFTASSYLEQQTEIFYTSVKDNTLKKSSLDEYCQGAFETSKLIVSNLDKAAQLIHSFKQVAVDQTTDFKRIFNLKSYLNDIVLSLKPQYKQGNHSIEILCPESLFIDSYPGALSQIFTNLILNSIIHGFENRKSGYIRIEVIVDGDIVKILYSDDGCGISKDVIGKIFEPFYTTKRGSGGTGLGLSIVYNLVKSKLKGDLIVSSDMGKGTFFTIKLKQYST
ncbi:MAG: hypothetical protein A2015_08325 [Spirochaetes bacterium GWF1_31_7]|nr:MAG: hypothetical protein A2Y30_08520 [Spirochaetes bacterium GWE1_32_154]OHD47154.1 MAG: hypothetical protein A2015_08325 [Spirochaetes bacterium GWF1_31_7]OHD47463.1 MAG: hypothetical protein A2Y29_08745 [Spirochaetes bacterium GWE2_31_10]